jgi:hypothetical protein
MNFRSRVIVGIVAALCANTPLRAAEKTPVAPSPPPYPRSKETSNCRLAGEASIGKAKASQSKENLKEVDAILWGLALKTMRELSQQPGVIVMAIGSTDDQEKQGSKSGAAWADRAEKYVASRGLRLVVLRPSIGAGETNQVYIAVNGKDAFPGLTKTGFFSLEEMSISKLDQVIAMKRSSGTESTRLPGSPAKVLPSH